MADVDWQESQDQNVFEMYVAHGGPGFWIRRTTWGGTCARIVRVGEITKPGPYFGNPSVLMDVYSLQGLLRDEAAKLPAAGTFKTWRKIHPPAWQRRRSCVPSTTPGWTRHCCGSIRSVERDRSRRHRPHRHRPTVFG